MRTAEEIVRYIQNEGDMLGFRAEALSDFLGFDEAATIRNPECTAEEWGATKDRTRENVLAAMRDYMMFAWEKAENHRGISASRSVEKMTAWLWLMGEPMPTTEYTNYGAPILMAICNRYGFPVPDSVELRRMAEGLPCRPDCDEGCGR